jgi:hypothetical protein
MGLERRGWVALLAPSLLALLVQARASDCNQNGLDDAEDIAKARSRDCNRNGVPDECDLAPTQLQFEAPRRTVVTILPTESMEHILPGDFNGDGKLDLVVEVIGNDNIGNRVSILLGAGDGTFGAPQTVMKLASLGGLAVADLNGDGKLDLAVGDLNNGVAILNFLEGNGDGTFRQPRTRNFDGGTDEIFAVDLDGNGALDLALIPSKANVVTIFRNTGNGLFSFLIKAFPLAATTTRLPQMFLLPGDFDQDGFIDFLAPADPASTGLTWLRNNGDATFDVDPVLDGVTFLGPPLVGDFNGDGAPDLIAGDNLFQNLGNATFAPAASVGLGLSQYFSAYSGVAVDLDRDGDLDLVMPRLAANPLGRRDELLLARNEGRGTFSPFEVLETGTLAAPVAALDLTGDGLPDLLLGSSGSLAVLVRRPGLGPTSLDVNANQIPDECETDCDRDGVPDSFAIATGKAADCNRNGIPDSCDVEAKVRFEEGDCLIQGTEILQDLVVVDLDNDGNPDLAALHRLGFFVSPVPNVFEEAQELDVFINAADGSFLAQPALDFDSPPGGLTAGDLDGDGFLDLFGPAWGAGSVLALQNDTTGIFSVVAEFPALRFASKVTAVDLNQDGQADLLVECGENDAYKAAVLLNQGGSLFSDPASFATLGQVSAILDLNGDAAPDLLTDYPKPSVSVTWNDGKGAFHDHRELAAGFLLVAGDLDRDGDIDLVVGDRATSVRSVLLNHGDGTFEKGGDLPATAAGGRLTDVDGDGNPDLIAAASGSRFAFARGDGKGHFAPAILVEKGPSFPFVTLLAADFDRDGHMDLAVEGNGDCPLSVYFNRTQPSSSKDLDHDGVPDECGAAQFRRGDSNGDGVVDLADPVAVLSRLFLGGEPLSCEKAADADDDGSVTITDPIATLNMLFLGSGPLPPPGPGSCGVDPTPDPLGCAVNC